MKNLLVFISLLICLANSCEPALAQVKKVHKSHKHSQLKPFYNHSRIPKAIKP